LIKKVVFTDYVAFYGLSTSRDSENLD